MMVSVSIHYLSNIIILVVYRGFFSVSLAATLLLRGACCRLGAGFLAPVSQRQHVPPPPTGTAASRGAGMAETGRISKAAAEMVI